MTAGIHGLIAVLMQHGQGQHWVHLDCRMPTAAFWQTADVSVAHTPPGREAWRLISQGAQDTSAFRSGVTAFHFRAPSWLQPPAPSEPRLSFPPPLCALQLPPFFFWLWVWTLPQVHSPSDDFCSGAAFSICCLRSSLHPNLLLPLLVPDLWLYKHGLQNTHTHSLTHSLTHSHSLCALLPCSPHPHLSPVHSH